MTKGWVEGLVLLLYVGGAVVALLYIAGPVAGIEARFLPGQAAWAKDKTVR